MSAAPERLGTTPGADTPEGITDLAVCQDIIEDFPDPDTEPEAFAALFRDKIQVRAAEIERKVIPLPDVSPQARRDARMRRIDVRNLEIDAADVQRTVARPPMALLPAVMRRFVDETAASFCMPMEMVLPFALAAVAGAIGNRRAIHVKNEWYESPALWLAVIARPGAGKSPLMRRVLAPVYSWEGDRAREHELMVQQMEEDNDKLKRSEIPPASRAIVSDVTIEKLALLMSENPHGLLLCRDELTAFAGAMGQYKASRGSDRSDYLSMWAGMPIAVDRKGTDSFRVEHPCLSVVGGIQPGLVRELASDKGDDGFIDRILAVYAEPLPRRWETPDVSLETSEEWDETIERLLGMRRQSNGAPVVLEMDDDARRRYGELYTEHFARQAQPDFPYRLNGAWAKLEVYAARLTLVLHMARLASGETHSESAGVASVEAAWALVRWFAEHAKIMRGLLTERPEDRLAGALVGWIKTHGGRTTVREVVRGHAVGIRSYSVAQDALDTLVDRALVIVESERKNSLVYRILTPEELSIAV